MVKLRARGAASPTSKRRRAALASMVLALSAVPTLAGSAGPAGAATEPVPTTVPSTLIEPDSISIDEVTSGGAVTPDVALHLVAPASAAAWSSRAPRLQSDAPQAEAADTLTGDPAPTEAADQYWGRMASHPTLPYTFLTAPSTGQVLAIYSPTGESVGGFYGGVDPNAMAFSPNGNIMYVASKTTNEIQVVDVQAIFSEGEPIIRTIYIDQTPKDIVVAPDGRLIVLGRTKIMQVDPETGGKAGPNIGGTDLVDSGAGDELELSPDGTRLYYSNNKLSPATFVQIDMTTNPPAVIWSGSAIEVGSEGKDLEISPDGTVIAFVALSGQSGIHRFETNDMDIAGSWNIGPNPRAVGFSPDGLYIYTSNTEGSIERWHATPPYTFESSVTLPDANALAYEIHVEPSGQVLYALATNGFAYPFPTGTVTEGAKFCGTSLVSVDMSQGEMPTEGSDVILGTGKDDRINTLGGAMDIVCGRGGDDVIIGGDGIDILIGNGGDDVLKGGAGDDVLIGDAGRDELDGGDGNDELDGGDDIDKLKGRDGDDRIRGDGGSDRIWGGLGEDFIEGGSGADRIRGGPHDDDINGMGGQDRIWGEGGDDVIQGSHQSDDIWGSSGDDDIRGAGGRDEIWGGSGNDTLYGGDNQDVLMGESGADLHDGGKGVDNCNRGAATSGDTFTRC